MSTGAKWTMGFVLNMNHAQFSQGLNRAVAGIRSLRQANAIGHRQALDQERNTRAAYANTRATVVRTAVAAAGLFTSLAVGRRAVISLTKAANEFQYEGAGLAAILGLQTGAGEKLFKQFEKVNPQIREFAPKEVLHRMKQLAQAGYSQSEIFRSMGAIFDTVTASFGELSTSQAVELGVNLHRAFGDAHNDMRSLLDTAVTAANKFPMTTAEIANAMGYATEAAVEYHQSLEGVLTSIGMLMPVTKSASKAGTVYRNSLLSLTKPKAIEFLNKYGIAVKNSNGEMRDQLDIYGDLFDVIEKIGQKDPTRLKLLKEQAMRELGGSRGGAMFAAYDRLASNNVGAAGTPWEGRQFDNRKTAVLAMRLGILDSSDAAKKLATQLRETSQTIEQRFNASLEKASITLGQAFVPTVDKLRKYWTGVMEDFSNTLGAGKSSDPSLFQGTGGNLAFMGINTGGLTAIAMGAIMSSGIVSRVIGQSRGLMWRDRVGYMDPNRMPGAWHTVRNRQWDPQAAQYSWQQKLSLTETLKAQSFGTSLMQFSGLIASLVTVGYSLLQIWKQTAAELYDFGERAAEKNRKRQEKTSNAEAMAWKFVSDKAEFKDLVKVKQGGYGPQTAFMLKRYQEGASPLQMYDEMVAIEKARLEKQIKLEGWSDEVAQKRRDEYNASTAEYRDTVKEHDAAFLAKKYERADKVGKAQIMAMMLGSLAKPGATDPEGFKLQRADLGTPDKPTIYGIASNLADAQARSKDAYARSQANGAGIFGDDAYKAAVDEYDRAVRDAKMFSWSSGKSMEEIRAIAAEYGKAGVTPGIDPYKSPNYVGSMPSDQALLDDPAASVPQMLRTLQEAARQAEVEAKDRARIAAQQTAVLQQIASNTANGGSTNMSVSP